MYACVYVCMYVWIIPSLLRLNQILPQKLKCMCCSLHLPHSDSRNIHAYKFEHRDYFTLAHCIHTYIYTCSMRKYINKFIDTYIHTYIINYKKIYVTLTSSSSWLLSASFLSGIVSLLGFIFPLWSSSKFCQNRYGTDSITYVCVCKYVCIYVCM